MGSVVVADEASQRAMEAADTSKEEGIVVMLITIPDPSEAGGVEATPRTRKINPPWNVGIVARKATRRASDERSLMIRRKPDLGPDGPNKESAAVTLHRRIARILKSRKGSNLRDETQSERDEEDHSDIGRSLVR